MAPPAEEIVKLDKRGLFCSMNIRGEVCIFFCIFLNLYFYTISVVSYFYSLFQNL